MGPEESENLVLTHLRELRAEMNAQFAEVKANQIEMMQRLGSLEASYANLSSRVDRLAGDVGRITRRLDAGEAFSPHA